MKIKHKNTFKGCLMVLLMLVIILDAEDALSGAKAGIELCTSSVIPALFPFCVISCMFRSVISGKSFKIFKPLEKLCGMPKNSGSIFVLGALGGYPIGAISIEQARENGGLSHADGQRILPYCNNPGPAFIFGLLIRQFNSISDVACIWLIVLASAILCGYLLKYNSKTVITPHSSAQVGFDQALRDSLWAMGKICGTVILFKLFIAIAEKWILWQFPKSMIVILTGVLELTNGIVSLAAISNYEFRFVLACFLLTFGGACVTLQTKAVCRCFSFKKYIAGKVLQGGISIALALFVVAVRRMNFPEVCIIAILLPATILLVNKYINQKNSSNSIANAV